MIRFGAATFHRAFHTAVVVRSLNMAIEPSRPSLAYLSPAMVTHLQPGVVESILTEGRSTVGGDRIATEDAVS